MDAPNVEVPLFAQFLIEMEDMGPEYGTKPGDNKPTRSAQNDQDT